MFGDTKAGQLLAANTILLAALAILWKDAPIGVSEPTLIVGGVAALLLAGSIVLILIAIAPAQHLFDKRGFWRNAVWTRLLGQHLAEMSDTSSLVHFSAITRGDVDDFIERVERTTRIEFERDLMRTIYGKSRWAQHKFLWLDRAVKALLAALAIAALCVPIELIASAL